MSGKYNKPHPERGPSNYHHRLARRGQKPTTVRMDDLDTLRARQGRRPAAGDPAIGSREAWEDPGARHAARMAEVDEREGRRR